MPQMPFSMNRTARNDFTKSILIKLPNFTGKFLKSIEERPIYKEYWIEKQ